MRFFSLFHAWHLRRFARRTVSGALIFLTACLAGDRPPDRPVPTADAPAEIVIRNATSAPVEYRVTPSSAGEAVGAVRVLGAGSIDRFPGDAGIGISFESGGRELVYQLDAGENYAFRHDLQGNLDLYVGSHTFADAPDLAPYVPTPDAVVDRMLELAEVETGDVIVDLGCGDGRIVVAAAEEYGARGFGVDIDPQRIEEANRLAEEAGVSRLVEFRVEDATKTDLSNATVVSLYLTPDANELIRPAMERQLAPGSRVVTHDYPIPGWTAERQETMEDESGKKHSLYLYVIGR